MAWNLFTQYTGTFLDLGASHQFQFLASKVSDDSPTKRVLPRTPGQPTNEMPPSKPPRHHLARSMTESTDSASYASRSYTGSIDVKRSAIDEGLRAALKRIAKEIESRKSGYQDRKPPPVSILTITILLPAPLMTTPITPPTSTAV